MFGQPCTGLLAVENNSHGLRSAALNNPLMEQSFRIGRSHQSQNLCAAARLSKYGYIVRITSKRLDIILNPF